MKTFIKLTLVLILLCNLSSYGSHLKGGEITWQCQGSQYVFTLKLYRDCNGIPLSTSQQLGSTIPGYSVIPVTLIADNDLTPPGCSFSCNNPFVGSVEEFIFTSGPITINGTPPTNGWEIYWNYECCRNATDNITPVSSQMHLRSWMYPYNPGSGNLNANPCYDNSPRFASPPTAFICVGYSFNQNAMGTDKDNDSLSYSFAYAQDDNAGVGINDPYINGFSIDSIMPGNPTIDSITGELHIFPTGSVSGNYTLATEVASYRCGQLIATVFREIQVTLSAAGCSGVIPIGGSTINHPPVVSPAPFQDPVTGLYTLYIDTVNAGDSIDFNLNVTELEQNATTLQYQNFWIDAGGSELDGSSVMPYNNCTTPPCAYFNSPLPQGPNTISHQLHFHWNTDCSHATSNCGGEYNHYFFVIRVKDDACPTPAINDVTFEIVVRSLAIVYTNGTLSANTSITNLQWYFNGTLISGATGNTYIPVAPGTYCLEATSASGCVLSNCETVLVVGNGEINGSSLLNLSPNPVSSILKISLPSIEREMLLTVNDNIGKKVLQQKIKLHNDTNFNLNIQSLQNGVYYLIIEGKENSLKQKFVVMK